MTFHSAVTDKVEPFLLRFATPQSPGTEMPGRYSAELGLWVVDREAGEVPIVEVEGGSLVVTVSKTMTQVEVDDEDPSRFGSMETGTFTKVRQEADDEDSTLSLPGLTANIETNEPGDKAAMPCW